MSDSRSVDSVLVQKSLGTNLLSIEAWGALSTSERMRLIEGRAVKFLDDAGNVIPTMSALRDLKSRAA